MLSMNPSLITSGALSYVTYCHPPLSGDGDIWIAGLLFYAVITVLFSSFCHQDCFVLKSFPVTGQTCRFFAQWTWVTTPFGYRTNVGSLKARLHTAHILSSFIVTNSRCSSMLVCFTRKFSPRDIILSILVFRLKFMLLRTARERNWEMMCTDQLSGKDWRTFTVSKSATLLFNSSTAGFISWSFCS